MLCVVRLELPRGVPVSGLVWMVLQGCRTEDPPYDKPGPTDSSTPVTTGTTGDTASSTGDNATIELPGTTEPVPDDQTIGSVRVEWNDMEHLLPNGSSLEVSAVFWEQIQNGNEYEILILSGLMARSGWAGVPPPPNRTGPLAQNKGQKRGEPRKEAWA